MSFLVLAVFGLAGGDERMARVAWSAMDSIARVVVAPLVAASLFSGIVQALCTPWGLFRHYWVVAKLILSVLIAVVLLLQMPLISHLARLAEGTEPLPGTMELRLSPALHAAGGLAVLLLVVAISIFKPKGLTRYGWRKLRPRDG